MPDRHVAQEIGDPFTSELNSGASMSLSDLHPSSLLASSRVSISLIYMNLQTRQNTSSTMGQNQQGRTDGITDWLNALASDTSLLDIYLRGTAGDPSINDIEAGGCGLHRALHLLDVISLISTAKACWTTPVMPALWKPPGAVSDIPAHARPGTSMRGTFDEGFQSFMDDLMREVPAQPTC